MPTRLPPMISLCALLGVAVWSTPVTGNEPGVDLWGHVVNTDPITDARIVTAGVGTSDGLLLQFQCSEGRFGAVIAPYQPMVALEFITMDDHAPVAWRIDSDPAQTESWRVLPGRAGSSFSVVSLDAAGFAAAVAQGVDRVIFRVHGLTGSVSLQGAAAHVAEAAHACDIPLG